MLPSCSKTVSTAAIVVLLLGVGRLTPRRLTPLRSRGGSEPAPVARSQVRPRRASSCSMRASISPKRFWSGALTSPARRERGDDRPEHLAAQHVERRQLRELLDVRAPRSTRPCITPPRISSTFVSRAESASAFATATMSPSLSMNAIADGPSSSASSASAPAASAARRVSVFLTTRELRPVLDQLARAGRRSGASSGRGSRRRSASPAAGASRSARRRRVPCLLSASHLLFTTNEPARRRARRQEDVHFPGGRLGWASAPKRAASCLWRRALA